MVRFGEQKTVDDAPRIWDFVYGGTNSPYVDQETAESGRVAGTPLMQAVNAQIVAEMKAAAKKMGQNPFFFEQIFETYNNAFWKDADKDIFRYQALVPGQRFREGNIAPEDAREFSDNPQSYELLVGYARWWYSSKIPGLAGAWGGESSGGGGGGGGRTGPSAQDIRNQFDLDQLSNRADDLFRAYLLDESDDPRGIAKDFVDEVVRTRGEKELDFDTFVLEKYIKTSPRHKSIYRNKPSNVDDIDYISRYHQMAQQILRPENVADVAIGGAQFGADAATFEDRLRRSNEYRTSTPFMQEVEARMSNIKDVFRG